MNRRKFLLGSVLATTGGIQKTESRPSRDVLLHLYLARHGQSEWNLQGLLQGSADIPLNDTGRQQAMALSTRLRGIVLDAVYASTLRRSAETAEIVHGSAALRLVPELNERRLGLFEGRKSDAEYERRSQDPDDTLDGGESLTAFFARVNASMAQILDRHRSGAILIVGHGGTNQMIMATLFRVPPSRGLTFTQANDDLYLCEITDRSLRRCWKLVDPL